MAEAIGVQRSSELVSEVPPNFLSPSTDGPVELSRGVDDASLSQLVADLSKSALLDRDTDALFQKVTAVVCDALSVDHAEILVQPGIGDPLVQTASSSWDGALRPVETEVACDRRSLAGYTLRSDGPVLVEDVGSDTSVVNTDRLVEMSVASCMSVAIPGPKLNYGVLSVHSVIPRTFSPAEGEFLGAIADILGSVIHRTRAIEQAEQSARYETALAECAQALLASTGDNRIQQALEALFVATEATYVFIERNVMHPEHGFSSETFADAGHSQDESGAWTDYWDLVPWAKMPTSRAALESGRSIVIIPEELDGPEFDHYAADPHPIESELDVPIFVNGEWAGLIGFADQTHRRVWSDSDISLLTTVAKMIGAFWEREAHQDDLLALNRAKDSFLATVSHELRTPLTAVVGFAQILQDSSDTMSSEERSELLELLVHNGTDVSNMVSDLLVAARADMGALEVSVERVDLRAQAAQVLESLEPEQSSQIDLAGESAWANGDPERVRQIIRNLVSNAIRYGGDTIRVEVRTEAEKASVLVCDNGASISEEDQERIFEPYQRAHDAPDVAGSVGLGLSISRKLARLMGGDLTLSRHSDENVFELSLACADQV